MQQMQQEQMEQQQWVQAYSDWIPVSEKNHKLEMKVQANNQRPNYICLTLYSFNLILLIKYWNA